MLDTEMLDKLGGPGGAYIASERPPPAIDEVFQRVAEDGWQPRNPVSGADLRRCEAVITRGDCLLPLIQPADTIYIDRSAKPLPGDIVAFSASQRLADLQNSVPPAGQLSPCKKGDRWLKLFVPYRGLDLLHERYGNSITTTLACCEDPDKETPILHPVVNVLRNGKLLFGSATDSESALMVPRRGVLACLALAGCGDGEDAGGLLLPPCQDGDASQIGTNAATDLYEQTIASASAGPTGSLGLTQDVCSITVPALPQAWTAIVTFVGTLYCNNGGITWLATIVNRVGSGGTVLDGGNVPDTASPGGSYAYRAMFSVAANSSPTFVFNWQTTSSGQTINGDDLHLQVEVIKK